MTDHDHTKAVRDAGYVGWTASVHRHPEATGFIAVMHSPDFNPITRAGKIVTARGTSPAEAFARVLESAKGTLH